MFKIVRNGLKENKGLAKRLIENLENNTISATDFNTIIDRAKNIQDRLKEVNTFDEEQTMNILAQLILLEYALRTVETMIDSATEITDVGN